MRTPHINLRETHIIGDQSIEQIIHPREVPGMQRLHMSLCGMSQADETFSFMRKRSPSHQVLIALSGSGRVLVNGDWHSLKPGEAYVTPSGIAHAYQALKNWSLAWVIYERALHIPQTVPCVVDASLSPVPNLLRSFYDEVHGAADDASIEAWLQLLHTHVCRLLGVEKQASRVQRLWQRVAYDLSEPWTIAELASQLSISEEHFRRLCHSEYAMSPQAYLLALRMQRAHDLLSATDLSVGAIAIQVSYQNAFAFATAFKRWSGLTPTQCRRMAKQ